MSEFDDGIDLGLDDGEEDIILEDVPKKPAPKKGRSKKATEPEAQEVAPPEPKKDTVTIMIDEEPNKSNYEFVGVNGVGYQIKRGVPVEVPVAVMHALKDAVMTKVEIRKHPITGDREEIVRSYPSIPWRRV